MAYVLRNRFNPDTQQVGGIRYSNMQVVAAQSRTAASPAAYSQTNTQKPKASGGEETYSQGSFNSTDSAQGERFSQATYPSGGEKEGYNIPAGAPLQNVRSGGKTTPISLSDWAVKNNVLLPGALKNVPLQPWESEGVNTYARGGVISEPVVGVGKRTGQQYMFGEQGPETVIPNGPIQQDTSGDDEQMAAELQRILGRRVIVRPNRPMKVRNTAVPESYQQGNTARAVNAPVIQLTTDDVTMLARDPRYAQLLGRLIEAEKRGGLSVTNNDGSPYGPQGDFGPGQQAGSPAATVGQQSTGMAAPSDSGFESSPQAVPESPPPQDSPLPPDSPTPPETQVPAGTPFNVGEAAGAGLSSIAAPVAGGNELAAGAESVPQQFEQMGATLGEGAGNALSGVADWMGDTNPQINENPHENEIVPAQTYQSNFDFAQPSTEYSEPMPAMQPAAPDAGWTFNDIAPTDVGDYDPTSITAPSDIETDAERRARETASSGDTFLTA